MTINGFFDFISSSLAPKMTLSKATPSLGDQIQRIGMASRFEEDQAWPSNVLVTACITVAHGKKRFRSSVISEAQPFQTFIEFRRQDMLSDVAIKDKIDGSIDNMSLPSPPGFLRRILDTPGKDFVSMAVRCFISETAPDILGYSKDAIQQKISRSFASNKRLVKMGLLAVVLECGLAVGTTSRLTVPSDNLKSLKSALEQTILYVEEDVVKDNSDRASALSAHYQVRGTMP